MPVSVVGFYGYIEVTLSDLSSIGSVLSTEPEGSTAVKFLVGSGLSHSCTTIESFVSSAAFSFTKSYGDQ